mmetsp:Transcript_109836/g.342354  ORF Transcript_109836/g.342354 Transcript_109836/m.342354 type:complete len:222 (+) Transcript_109836:209-874(+)
MFSHSVTSLGLSSALTSVRQTTVAVFWWTRLPRRALSRTMQYGMPILRQRAGSQTTSSMGSTLWAMHTSLAFLASTSVVTWLRPNLMTHGLVDASRSLAATFFSAASDRRFFLSALVSGRYLARSLKSSSDWFFSSVLVNWLTDGGTLMRWTMTAFWRCRRTYLGHLTKRPRSRLGWMAPPMPKLRGRFSNRGFEAFLDAATFLTPAGGAATFFPLGMFFC